MKKVVVIGAGTGQAQILRGIKDFKVQITSIVGVTDNGGHSGYLRKVLGIPSVGDIRNCFSALVNDPIFVKRINKGVLEGAQVGNLVFASLLLSTKKLSKAAEAACRAYRVRQKLLPVSDGSSHVCAKFENGQMLEGEWQIMKSKINSKISRLYHKPPLVALKSALSAIRNADWIIITPGALVTGLGSVLSAVGIKKAFLKSLGKVIYILNIMTQPGRKDFRTASEHVRFIAKLIGKQPDYALVNSKLPARHLRKVYLKHGSRQVIDDLGDTSSVFRFDIVGESNVSRGKQFASLPHLIVHDPRKTARAIRSILEQLHF